MNNEIKKMLRKSEMGNKLLELYSAFREVYSGKKNEKNARFKKDYATFFQAYKERETRNFLLDEQFLMPIVDEFDSTQSFHRDYIYHTAWAARKVKQYNPENHVDISSSLYFTAILSAFVPVYLYDYRVTSLLLDNVFCGKADLTNLHFADNSISSLSCLNVVEHIGLGRYGDEIDPLADLKAMKELQRVLCKGGRLLFNVPVHKNGAIYYNAHRVYTKEMILDAFSGLKCEEFLIINTISDVPAYFESEQDPRFIQFPHNKWASGCFQFTK